MNAFVFWSMIIGTDSNSSHFTYVNYSAELLELCEKVAVFYEIHY